MQASNSLVSQKPDCQRKWNVPTDTDWAVEFSLPPLTVKMALRDFLLSRHSTLDAAAESTVIEIVAGNESADLDSISCAILLAYLRQVQNPSRVVLPFVNILECDFSLRSETVYVMKTLDLPSNGLFFQDTVDLASLHAAGRLVVRLVDHNAPSQFLAPYSSAIAEIIDHHVVAPDTKLPSTCNIQMVGSCAALVGEEISKANLLDNVAAYMILACICIDTGNLDPAASRATPLDVQIATQCELLLSLPRKNVFESVLHAKSDITAMATVDVLRKDCKLFPSRSGDFLMCAVPTLLDEFLHQRSDIWTAIATMGTKFYPSAVITVLMGLAFDPLRRQILYVSHRGHENLATSLFADISAPLQLKEISLPGLPSNAHIFEQGDVKASRKQVQPLILRFMDKTASM